MKFKSDRLEKFARLLADNTKYSFGLKLGRYTLTVTENLDIAEKIFDLCVSDKFWLSRIRAGGKLMFVDHDIRLNIQWAKIWS